MLVIVGMGFTNTRPNAKHISEIRHSFRPNHSNLFSLLQMLNDFSPCPPPFISLQLWAVAQALPYISALSNIVEYRPEIINAPAEPV
jgi:hypothetical protein